MNVIANPANQKRSCHDQSSSYSHGGVGIWSDACRSSYDAAVSTRTFNVTGFTTLPAAMVYTDKLEVSAQIPGTATSERGAQAFVKRMIMQTTTNIIMANWSSRCGKT
ncbi:hypothetical protein KIN20_028954 [Parelaphostrongylus tenuis]|uniref:Uncharacterized protein n=1 Tax=Parelaphostrongylus tenuis TaxID=148309 RepID=A0AAD5WF77_PARTN|nr:hypothetical protein KIN20_028954 [Parelaphostrongylus tenuis]